MSAKVPVSLEHAAALTTDDVDELPPGQAHWWLRNKQSEFVRLPKRVRGDEALKLLVHLEPGHYVLGVGPAQMGVREDIEVIERVAEPEAATSSSSSSTSASLDVTGKSFVITGDLDAMDRDSAAAWLKKLGAKVTTSVSGKTTYLVVGRVPGAKKIEKAEELGITQLTEEDLRTKLGFPAPSGLQAPQTPLATRSSGMQSAQTSLSVQTSSALSTKTENNPKAKVVRLLKGLNLEMPAPKVASLVGPSHFRDLGLVDNELWGIAVGPRGGEYSVHVDLNDRPQWGIRCNCKDRNPCKHGLALLFTAVAHFVPPAPSPEGHREASRYVATWE